jgi:hypothetical protein
MRFMTPSAISPGPSSGSTAAPRSAPPPQWVLQAVQGAINSPSSSLLHLLLSPLPALQPWVHALSAQLVAAGLLDAHLARLRDACQASMWQGVAGRAPAAGGRSAAAAATDAWGGNGYELQQSQYCAEMCEEQGMCDTGENGSAHTSSLSAVVQHAMQQVVLQVAGDDVQALNTAAVPLLLCVTCLQHPACCVPGAPGQEGLEPGALHHAIAARQGQLQG